MDALVLAGGSGSRMQLKVGEKPLVSICGRPMISWVVDALRSSARITRVWIAVSPQTPETRRWADFAYMLKEVIPEEKMKAAFVLSKGTSGIGYLSEGGRNPIEELVKRIQEKYGLDSETEAFIFIQSKMTTEQLIQEAYGEQ